MVNVTEVLPPPSAAEAEPDYVPATPAGLEQLPLPPPAAERPTPFSRRDVAPAGVPPPRRSPGEISTTPPVGREPVSWFPPSPAFAPASEAPVIVHPDAILGLLSARADPPAPTLPPAVFETAPPVLPPVEDTAPVLPPAVFETAPVLPPVEDTAPVLALLEQSAGPVVPLIVANPQHPAIAPPPDADSPAASATATAEHPAMRQAERASPELHPASPGADRVSPEADAPTRRTDAPHSKRSRLRRADRRAAQPTGPAADRSAPSEAQVQADAAAVREARVAADLASRQAALEAYRRFAREGTMVFDDYYRGPAGGVELPAPAPAVVMAESLIPVGRPRLAPQPDKGRGRFYVAALAVVAIAGGACYYQSQRVSVPAVAGPAPVILDRTVAEDAASFAVPAAATSGHGYRLTVPAGWKAVSRPTRPGGTHTDVAITEPILGLSVVVSSQPAAQPAAVAGTPVANTLRIFGEPATVLASSSPAGSPTVSRTASVTVGAVRYDVALTVPRRSAGRDYGRADAVARSITGSP